MSANPEEQVPAAAPADNADLDPKKAAKKALKDAEKAAKLAKLAAKQQAQASQPTNNADSKKAKEKAEAALKRQNEAKEVEVLLEAVRNTPKGEKKSTAGEMYKAYHPKIVETAWYEWWEKSGYFKPADNDEKPPFVIVIPPPNVTGALHIGHALTNSIQDTIVRWRRMSGYNVLWVPGTDHAGIATQTVVEKKLKREKGITRHDLGREKFLEEVWTWVGEYGHRIHDQLRRLGSSVDWSRSVFTMDSKLSRAVNEAFVKMYEQGAIYRDNRLVNWCCTLKTAVSDIEVDYIDVPKRTLLAVPGYAEPVEFGAITSFAYPIEPLSDPSDSDPSSSTSALEIVVATTRPETMLGDTAIAIHPEDPRYTALHGRFAIHPVSGRRIPIICDAELVDMSFGTGAVKVTPAHDPNDFATGKRHNLEFINILDDLGRINANGGSLFAGQPRFRARITVVDFLKEKGLFRGVEDNPMRLGICSRSSDVIEPVLKPQWWVSSKSAADRSCAAVRDGSLEIIPREFEATWFRWLENIRDWCISRQLWWGHRIPAYYIVFADELPSESASPSGSSEAWISPAGTPGSPSENMGRWVVARSPEEARVVAEAKFPDRAIGQLLQDEDVLDTWFSSGLFPFSVFGWPEQSPDLSRFYPGALLETGHDILFFWVARMVMMGLSLTDQIPFKQVYLHAMVRDAHGRKMSKSLGNVIDPLHVIEGISLQGLHDTLTNSNLDPKEVTKATDGQKEDFPEGIEECGTDALRFALVAYTSQGRDINLDIKRVVAYRHWCNKLWNAIRFAMMNLGEGFQPCSVQTLNEWIGGGGEGKGGDSVASTTGTGGESSTALPLACRWILSRLNGAVAQINKALETYDFATATQRVYSYWQYEVCDVFIELVKPVVAGKEGNGEGEKENGENNNGENNNGENNKTAAAATSTDLEKLQFRNTLWVCLDYGLKLLHPFMPYVTEELWQKLPKRATKGEEGEEAGLAPSIMLAQYPTAQSAWEAPALEALMVYLDSVVSRVRSLRTDYGLASKQRPQLFVAVANAPEKAAFLKSMTVALATLTTSSSAEILDSTAAAPQGCSVSIVDDQTTVLMQLKGILDPAKEVQKLDKKVKEVQAVLQNLAKKMERVGYETDTPAEFKQVDQEKKSKAEAELAATVAAKAEMERLALAGLTLADEAN